MKNNHKNYRKFLEQFCKVIEDMSSKEPVKYLSVMALSSLDSEREPQVISGEIKDSQTQIVREFYFRSHRN
ncbi:MAG: hypothetical protein WD037_13510 [Balneolales bacterium]